MKPKWIGISVLVLGLSLTFSRAATADVELCNNSANGIWVAFAMRGEHAYRLQGWERLTSGRCKPIRSDKIRSGHYLYFAAVKRDYTVVRIKGAEPSSSGGEDFKWCVHEDLAEKFEVEKGKWEEFEPPCKAGWMEMSFQKYLIQQGNRSVPIVTFVD